MRKKDPKIIRIGDCVKIVKPELFVRCGYPLTFEEARRIVEENYKKQIEALIDNTILENYSGSNDTKWSLDEHCVHPCSAAYYIALDRIISGLAYYYMSVHKFGGSERKIYTKSVPEYKGIVVKVTDIKFVKTGYYVAGGTGCSYDSMYLECDPPYLDQERTHKILTIEEYPYFKIVGYDDHIRIEAANVEKVFADK